MVVSVLLKIKFGHAQISVPKIGKPMLKIACINPWCYLEQEQIFDSFAENTWKIATPPITIDEEG